MAEYKRKCAECKIEFMSSYKCVRLCDNCRRKHAQELAQARQDERKQYTTKICAVCKKEFITSRSVKIYCSQECAKSAYNQTLKSMKIFNECKKFDGMKRISEAVLEAEKIGVSYGVYMADKGVKW